MNRPPFPFLTSTACVAAARSSLALVPELLCNSNEQASKDINDQHVCVDKQNPFLPPSTLEQKPHTNTLQPSQ